MERSRWNGQFAKKACPDKERGIDWMYRNVPFRDRAAAQSQILKVESFPPMAKFAIQPMKFMFSVWTLDSFFGMKGISRLRTIQPHPVSKLDRSRCCSVLWGSCLQSSSNLLLQHLANIPGFLVILWLYEVVLSLSPFKSFSQIFCSFTNVGFFHAMRSPCWGMNCAVFALQTLPVGKEGKAN